MAASRTILAIDQGTTNTKAVLVDGEGAIVARASSPLAVRYPQPGWVEQDPLALWRGVQESVAICLRSSSAPAPAAIAVSNQRESIILWERDGGAPLGPCIVWQCRRTAPFCAALREKGLEPLLHARTGLTIDPLFSASKARWLLDHVPHGQQRAERGEICLGTVDSWLLWNLTAGQVHACDMTNAARTQLFDLHDLVWSPDLLAIFGVPAAALPEVRTSDAIFGVTRSSPEQWAIPAGLPIAAMIGDSHAALFGQGGFQAGAIKATYGTGSSLMTPVARAVLSHHGISTTVAWARHDTDTSSRVVTYALEGNISVTGAAVHWLGELLNLADPAADVAALAERVPDAGGVFLVPAFVGLGAPHWDDAARGVICGITQATTAAHLARATIEAIAHQVADVFEAMETDCGAELCILLADGGASRNDLLMQFQADILGRPVQRSSAPDSSALGAAYLAGLTVGLWSGEADLATVSRAGTRFTPRLSPAERAAVRAGWHSAVARARTQSQPEGKMVG